MMLVPLGLFWSMTLAVPPHRPAPPVALSLEDSTRVMFKARGVSQPSASERPSTKAASPRAERVRATQSIAGGREAAPGRWPFSVAITYRNQQGTLTQYCSGSLISPDTVLTAAHCEVSTGHYAVIGRHDLSTTRGRALRIVAVTSPVGFDSQSFQNDVALLRLAAPVTEFAPVRLAEPDLVLEEGQALTTLGWGRAHEGHASTPVLREVAVQVAPRAACATRYRGKYPITPGMLCVSAPGTADACPGDSGGPLLMTTAEGKVLQVGITSFGVGCARPDFPGVSTQVSSFRKWMAHPVSP
ncbi:serine protease [Corallococcus exiguus]|uniref:serine protease n=1 Tax=Corallococcus TaxID=83461 RepID=UPI001315A3D2|nr:MULTISPECIES: serine protease [Corallococcus]NPC45937.1 serine protease [Corallococcus exiguus]NRD44931.1 serine protease [Corallococcus exiguus]